MQPVTWKLQSTNFMRFKNHFLIHLLLVRQIKKIKKYLKLKYTQLSKSKFQLYDCDLVYQ